MHPSVVTTNVADQLSDEEIRLLRTMLATAVLKDQADERALRDLMYEVRKFRDTADARLARLEKFMWAVGGGAIAFITGMPSAVFIVNLVQGNGT